MMQRTIPWQMFSGIRQADRPDDPARAAMLEIVANVLLARLEVLRRHNERMRGIRPT
jgi:putative spermidine/putrescine transport system permease protein